jgi:uncharacterized membrane protein
MQVKLKREKNKKKKKRKKFYKKKLVSLEAISLLHNFSIRMIYKQRKKRKKGGNQNFVSVICFFY